jgi:hypothetical protein
VAKHAQQAEQRSREHAQAMEQAAVQREQSMEQQRTEHALRVQQVQAESEASAAQLEQQHEQQLAGEQQLRAEAEAKTEALARERAARLMRRTVLRLRDRALLCCWSRWAEVTAATKHAQQAEQRACQHKEAVQRAVSNILAAEAGAATLGQELRVMSILRYG